MLDAAVVVPKGPQEPFLLPNSDPWGFLATWDRGEPAGPTPPAGKAEWLASTLTELGPAMEVSEHATVVDAVRAVAALPAGDAPCCGSFVGTPEDARVPGCS